MEKKSRLIKTLLIAISAAVIITLIVVAAILSGFGVSGDRDGSANTGDGEENTGVENGGGEEDSGEGADQGDESEMKNVSYYLAQKNVPFFAPSYLDVVEATYRRRYYKPEQIPDSEALATEIASLYNEYLADIIDSESYMDVTYALIDCLIEAVGDKYAFYRTREQALEYDTNMSGSFAGIGVEIIRNNIENTILVDAVHVDSPADSAGILPGDYVVGVDGFSIDDIGAQELVNKIRGEVGAPLTVTVKRGDTLIELEMVRAPLTERTVRLSYLGEGNKIACVRVTGFKDNTDDQFIEAINELEVAGAQAVIFDLRGNGGGYLAAVVNMLSYLVPDGTPIVSFSDGREPMAAGSGTDIEPTDHALKIPSVVVVNERSASASELFTASMRDYNDMDILDSTVVGTVTYKKGVMQSTTQFSDGSTLTLTISLYNPPSGVNFDGVGVEPDVHVNEDEDAMKIAQSIIEEKINLE